MSVYKDEATKGEPMDQIYVPLKVANADADVNSPDLVRRDPLDSNDHPALHIAHCIRDLAYGEESRSSDLVAMVRSEEPVYRDLFVEALWIDPPGDPRQEQRKPDRKPSRKKTTRTKR